MGTRILVLKDGLMQQIDTPQNLYDRPDNLFVAGFIGSPSMNFFDAVLVERDGKVAVDTRDFLLDVPEDKADVYREHVGKDVVFGMRPDNTHDLEFAPPGISQSIIEAKVEVTELLGNEVIVHLSTDHHQFLGRFDPRTNARVGNTLSVALDMDSMQIFDKKTERAIR
jgi:multiple sugar transport system ATP-binding protein